MKMKVVQLPLLRDNYAYLIVCEERGEAAVIDPSEAEPVVRRLEEEQVRLGAILNTHHHWDHTGGNPQLLERFPVEVYGHRTDRDRIPGLTRPLDEGDEVCIGNLRGTVLFIPGHTRGHIAYLFGDKLFCGDTLFVAGCGRLFEGTAVEMHASLGKLASLPRETRVYCGHEYTEKNLQFALTVEPGNREAQAKMERVVSLREKGLPTVPSTIGEEQETNPFLRLESDEIRRHFHKDASDPVAVFAELRRLKDQF
jgi:hydroxyacylglutathione hydrolase